MNDAEKEFGTEQGQYLHFDFYVERDDKDPISPDEAHDLYWHLINWIRERGGYGFDGGAKLGNWLMKSPEEERQ